MVIERNGQPIELTEDEMKDAFWEQLRKYRTEELLDYLQNWADEDGYNKELTKEKCKNILDKLNNDSALLAKVASQYEKYHMDYPDGEQEQNCVFYALDYYELF